MYRIGALRHDTWLHAMWPDGGDSPAWVAAAGTPVRVFATVRDGMVHVEALDARHVIALVPLDDVDVISPQGATPF